MDISIGFEEKFELEVVLREEIERNKDVPFMLDRNTICESILKKIKEKWEGKTVEKYIVRGDRSGVFYGEIKDRNGKEVTMTNCRRIWHWEGANSISQLARLGTSKPESCQITTTVEEVIILDVIEIDKCSHDAIKVLDGVKEWIA